LSQEAVEIINEEIVQEIESPETKDSVVVRLYDNCASTWVNNLVTQDEVNALISTYDLVNHNQKQRAVPRSRSVRMFDFSIQDKISSEQVRILKNVHESFAEIISAELAGAFRAPVSTSLLGIEPIKYKDYFGSISPNSLVVDIAGIPLSSSILMEISPSLVGPWIDCLCGGDPDGQALNSKLSPLDIAIVKGTVKKCNHAYREAWKDVFRFHPEVVQAVSSDEYTQRMPPTASMLLCTFEMSVGQSYGLITICLVATEVESLLSSLEIKADEHAGNQGMNALSPEIEKALDNVEIDMSVILGSATISVSDLINLRAGDVIKTSRKADKDLTMRVGGKEVFSCRPGTVGRTMGVVISDILDKEALADLAGPGRSEQQIPDAPSDTQPEQNSEIP